jgi:predicted  nucleic acid-binding Zn-ribbon protein
MMNAEIYETEDAVEVLDALHSALTSDLQDLETRIAALDAGANAATQDRQAMAQYRDARTALHSGLASIAEVLGWIEWKTEQEPDGEVAVAVQPLPTLRGYLVH